MAKKVKAPNPKKYDMIPKRMGVEPNFAEPKTLSYLYKGSREMAKTRGLNWYNYFYDLKDYKAWKKVAVEQKWLRSADLAVVENVLQFCNSSVLKLCEMVRRGWILTEEEADYCKTAFVDVLERGKIEAAAAKEAEKLASATRQPPKRTPVPKLLLELDDLEDCWMNGEYPAFNLYNRSQACGENKKTIEGPIKDWVSRRLDEIRLVKTDPQVKEAYSHMDPKDVRKMAATLEAMMADIERLCVSKPRVVRKPKEKKVDLDKAVAKLLFLKTSAKYKIESVDPRTIVGAKALYVFDVERRKLKKFVALEGGLQVSGSSIRNYDVEASRETTLRKPSDMLDTIRTKSDVAILKAWQALTTKDGKPGGRISEECLLLKVEK